MTTVPRMRQSALQLEKPFKGTVYPWHVLGEDSSGIASCKKIHEGSDQGSSASHSDPTAAYLCNEEATAQQQQTVAAQQENTCFLAPQFTAQQESTQAQMAALQETVQRLAQGCQQRAVAPHSKWL